MPPLYSPVGRVPAMSGARAKIHSMESRTI
jgi:hypothetical protein